MALTGITWLTGEVVDENRLNQAVANTEYVKSMYSVIHPYSATAWSATSWAAVPAWATGQIIDEARLNQMYTNQAVLQSVVDVHTVWDFQEEHWFGGYVRLEPLPRGGLLDYQFVYYDKIMLLANGVKIGSTLSLPVNDGVWNTMSIANIPLEGYEDYSVVKLGFWFGETTVYTARFVKLPEMHYVSYWVKAAKTYGQNTWNWKELVVRAHRSFTNW